MAHSYEEIRQKEKHLEFIQNSIARMNTNSFQIKGWAVTIVSALLAVYAAFQIDYFILAAIFPAVVFWFLDANYLVQERRFRGLYDDVAGVSENPKDVKPFDMCLDPYKREYPYCEAFCSYTVRGLYLPVIFALVGLFFYFHDFTKGA